MLTILPRRRILSSGEIALEGPEDPSLGIFVERIEIKYLVRYKALDASSLLDITMTRPIKKSAESGVTSSVFRGTSDFAAIKRRSPRGGPHQWIEASISSSILEGILGRNVRMGFAERSRWTSEELKAAGAFEDICRPGLDMISCMDGIGAANDNGRGPSGQTSVDGPSRSRGSGNGIGSTTKFEYW